LVTAAGHDLHRIEGQRVGAWRNSFGIRIEIGADRRAVTAVQADEDERARLWPRRVAAYAGSDSYQNWTTRELPVMVLQPH
jgi:F420H(2)-dependent quinone reductase